jgi:Tfp pilus assembly protein PilX
MVDPKRRQKGIVLVLVLATILIVVLLGIAILNIISSQSRLTHHQLSRIQAYYANKAVINYAFEQLRTGAWVPGTNCTAVSPCVATQATPNFGLNLAAGGDFLPPSITSVSLTITPAGTSTCPAGNCDCVNATATYTHTEP